jgi:hypothetical protein
MAMGMVEVASILVPVSEEAEDRKREAKRHWETIRKSGVVVSVNSLRIGFHAFALKRDGLFGILGFGNEKEAQEASGVKDSTWFNVIRIAEAYPGVEEELFVGMKLSNAQELMDLPESKRLTEYWLRRAATDSMDTFKAVVEEEMNGKARSSDGREQTVAYSVKMPKSTRKAIQTGLLEYAKEVGEAGNEAKALELMVAEHTGGTSLIAAITFAINRIADLKKLGDSGLSAAEALEKVYTGLDEVVEGFRVSLESVQNLESPE